VHSSEQPSEAKRDGYCPIGLIFDGVAQCLLKGTDGLGGAVDGLAIEVLGGIRYFTGLFLGDISMLRGCERQRARMSEGSSLALGLK
jgi:hypothetical protein